MPAFCSSPHSPKHDVWFRPASTSTRGVEVCRHIKEVMRFVSPSPSRWTQHFIHGPFCHNCVHFGDHAFLTLPLFHNTENMHNVSAATLIPFSFMNV